MIENKDATQDSIACTRRGWLRAALACVLPHTFCLSFLGWFICPAAHALPTRYDFVVAQDGSGDFTTVQAAIEAVPERSKTTTAIYIKAGTYTEKILVRKSKHNVELVGESAETTVLTWNDYGGEDDTAFYTEGVSSTASTHVSGDDFTARNLTFANSAGASSQATALAATGRRGRFFNCRFLGYQDTLLAARRKQYFKHCYIEGAVDFIYGDATAVFSHCTIFCVNGGFITAADTPATRGYGFVFRDCKVTGSAPDASVFLGRPWGDTGRVVFLRCDLGPQIHPAGWIESGGDGGDNGSTFYAEYKNVGEGAQTAGRVDWSAQLTDDEAGEYSLKKVFGLEDTDARETNPQEPWFNEGP